MKVQLTTPKASDNIFYTFFNLVYKETKKKKSHILRKACLFINILLYNVTDCNYNKNWHSGRKLSIWWPEILFYINESLKTNMQFVTINQDLPPLLTNLNTYIPSLMHFSTFIPTESVLICSKSDHWQHCKTEYRAILHNAFVIKSRFH